MDGFASLYVQTCPKMRLVKQLQWMESGTAVCWTSIYLLTIPIGATEHGRPWLSPQFRICSGIPASSIFWTQPNQRSLWDLTNFTVSWKFKISDIYLLVWLRLSASMIHGAQYILLNILRSNLLIFCWSCTVHIVKLDLSCNQLSLSFFNDRASFPSM